MLFCQVVVLVFVAAVVALGTGTIDGDIAAIPYCGRACIQGASDAAGCASTGSSAPSVPHFNPIEAVLCSANVFTTRPGVRVHAANIPQQMLRASAAAHMTPCRAMRHNV